MATIKKTFGGDRLGSEQKMTIKMHGFGRSSHNIGMLFKTDQAFATLVPYFCDVATNGTTYYMDINIKDRTLPTASAPFAVMKHQIDVFAIPLRLYISALHNNTLGIGLKMSQIKTPKMIIPCNKIDFEKDGNPNLQQVSNDSLIAYLGISGLGSHTDPATDSWTRAFPSFFVNAYYDIYKNYYSNKQEGIGYIITNGIAGEKIAQMTFVGSSGTVFNYRPGQVYSQQYTSAKGENIRMYFKQPANREDFLNVNIIFNDAIRQMREIVQLESVEQLTPTFWIAKFNGTYKTKANSQIFAENRTDVKLQEFDLKNIDDMREKILTTPWTTEMRIDSSAKYPYLAITKDAIVQETYTSGSANWYTQNGLAIRTYLSDRFNNFLSKEWIEGANGINEITAIDVSDGKLHMDSIILQEKIFKMMNRIAMSDGSFQAWQEAVYGQKAISMSESPVYVGGMASEIVFGEVVSNSASGDEPLGTLAGKGMDANSRGGKLKIKVKEPSLIMVIGSIVPRVDYSQGNEWWNEIESMDDLHKPSLDAIGFQDLTTEEFAAWNTKIDDNGKLHYNSIGKQVSWIQYMTKVSKSYGGFGAGGNLSFMAPNREYHHGTDGSITDATTYIDPTIFNNLFADLSLAAKPIWVQAAFDVTARRVMSAKQIPSL